MYDFFSFLLLLFLVPYLVVPVIIRRKQLFSLKPNVRPVLDGYLPEAVEKYFTQSSTALQANGFEYRIDAVSLDYGPNMKVFLRLFVATKQSLIAICASLVPEGTNVPLRNFIELSSRFSDGREVSTHNSDLAGAPIEPRQKYVSVLPNVADVNVLMRIHHQVIERRGLKNTPALCPEPGTEFDFLVQNFKDDLSHQARLGCLHLDENNHCYRPTWAGAFLMGWYSLWPIGPARRLFQKTRARIQIKALLKANA